MKTVRPIVAVLSGVLLSGTAAPSLAQDRDYVSLEWWHPLVASAGIAATFLLDQPTHDYMVGHQGATATDVAKNFHEAEGTLASSGGLMAGGLILRDMKVAQTGMQVLVSYGLTAGIDEYGRARLGFDLSF